MAKPEDNDLNLARCNCPNCQTMNDCGRQAKERLFCARGKGTCGYKLNGCICPQCPVYKENKLKYNYYCRRNLEE